MGKLIYAINTSLSTTLDTPLTRRTRIVRTFDADEVRALKAASSADLLVGGPGLAADALRAGVVDEVRLALSPVTVGVGKPAFPRTCASTSNSSRNTGSPMAQCRSSIACGDDVHVAVLSGRASASVLYHRRLLSPDRRPRRRGVQCLERRHISRDSQRRGVLALLQQRAAPWGYGWLRYLLCK